MLSLLISVGIGWFLIANRAQVIQITNTLSPPDHLTSSVRQGNVILSRSSPSEINTQTLANLSDYTIQQNSKSGKNSGATFGQSFLTSAGGKITNIEIETNRAQRNCRLTIYKDEGLGGWSIHKQSVNVKHGINWIRLSIPVAVTAHSMYTFLFENCPCEPNYKLLSNYDGGNEIFYDGTIIYDSDLKFKVSIEELAPTPVNSEQ